MRQPNLSQCYQTLELPRDAGAEQVRAAFRRLARRYHPDISQSATTQARFVEVVRAYRVLRERNRRSFMDTDWGQCDRCGEYEDLFDDLQGRRACADCLLGIRRKRRLLPAPLVVVARHVAVCALYLLALLFTALHFVTDEPHYVEIAVVSMAAGLAALAVEVIWLTTDR